MFEWLMKEEDYVQEHTVKNLLLDLGNLLGRFGGGGLQKRA